MKTCTTRLTGDYSVNPFPRHFEWILLLVGFFLLTSLVSAQTPCTPALDCTNRIVSCADPAADPTTPRDDLGYLPAFTNACSFSASDLIFTPWPVAINDCDSIYTKVIYRMWGVPGYPSLCTDTTYVLRVDILSDSLICPDGRDTILCGIDPNPLDSLELRAPLYAIPGIDTFALIPNGPACGVFVSVQEDPWPSCGNTGTVIRTWTLHDECSNEVICSDTIVIIDTVPPSVSFDTSKLDLVEHEINGITKEYLTDTIGMAPSGCVGHGLAPYATVSDNCSDIGDVTVSVSGVNSLAYFHYAGDEVITLPLWNIPGEREILVYQSVDACHNTRLDTVILIISDQTPATAVCHDAVNLSLVNVNQFTYMKAASMDAESYDNCAVYLILARRTDWMTACGYQEGEPSEIGDYYQHYADWVEMDPGICQDVFEFGFAPEVPFCCEDVGSDIMVELMIIDLNCNVDRCWGIVHVEDKLPPIVVEPLPDITITCNAYTEFYQDMFEAEDLDAIREAFGKYVFDPADQDTFAVHNILCGDPENPVNVVYNDGLLNDNCNSNLSERFTLHQVGCGNGYIQREFTSIVSNDHGMQEVIIATQKIYIERCPMDLMNITLPLEDTVVYSCGITYGLDGKVAIETPGPIVPTDFSDCSQYGVGYYDKVFEIVTGVGCYKVLRTWCVVDWCEVNTGGDWASMAQQPGTLTFLQYIKVIDTVPPDIQEISMVADIETVNCFGLLSAQIDASDLCGTPNVKWELRTQAGALVVQGTGQIAEPEDSLPPGAYSLIWTATDPCGNVSKLTSNFTISSGALPGVVARSSLTTTLTPMDGDNDGAVDFGMSEIWAEEFNSSSSPACGGDPGNLLFLIARGFADENSPVPPHDSTSLQFTCADFVADPTVIPVQFWVKDTVSGEADFANVFVMLYDNNNICQIVQQPPQTGALVSGQIITETQEQIANVQVKVANNTTETIVMTGVAGLYEVDLPIVDRTMIVPAKNTDHANGISTADLIKVQKHILGIKPLTSPYKLIAADANRDQKINPIDLIQMRKLLLGKIQEFPQNTSWRFVDAGYRFARPEKALETDFPEYIEVYATSGREAPKNFIGIKIGDLDDNVFTSRAAGRSAYKVIFSLADKTYRPGEVIRVPVYSNDDWIVEGMQLQFQVDPAQLRLMGIENGQMTIDGEETQLNFAGDRLAISTVQMGGAYLERQQPLFYLHLETTGSGKLSDALTLAKTGLYPEAYLTNEEVTGIALTFSDELTTGLLMQNRPNPFRSETVIEFWMPDASEARLRIMDPAGKVLKEYRQYFDQGFQQVTVDRSELTPGVLYYELQTHTGRETKRMILIE